MSVYYNILLISDSNPIQFYSFCFQVLDLYASVSVYSSTPGDISVTIGGADCAVTSANNTELECVTGPHTLSDYIFILQFHSRGHQCDYRWCRLCCYISQ